MMSPGLPDGPPGETGKQLPNQFALRSGNSTSPIGPRFGALLKIWMRAVPMKPCWPWSSTARARHRVDAVRVARRVDVQDEPRDDRGRVVGEVRGHVGAVDAHDGLALEEPVDDDVDVVDLAVVEGPPGDLRTPLAATEPFGCGKSMFPNGGWFAALSTLIAFGVRKYEQPRHVGDLDVESCATRSRSSTP